MTFRRNIRRYADVILALPVIVMLLVASCQRRLLEYDEIFEVALIPVNIDWSATGLTVTGNNRDVQKVSIRFFPQSGTGEAFDCYMEPNVSQGEIAVPVGRYSVIVFNESIYDNEYWADRVTFSDANSYNDFAANAVVLSNAARLQQFPYYQPQTDERFIVEPRERPVASWSLPDFEVTNNMILVSQGLRPASLLSAAEENMFNALTHVTMRALTRPVTVTAQVQNLVSARTMYLAMRGLASKVYMASGNTTSSPSTYLFILNGRQYASNNRDGTARNTFLCFGRTSDPEYESYYILADILFVNYTLYEPASPLLFNRTNEFKSGNNTINLDINIELPFIEGGIAVNSWGDDEQRTVIQ